MDVYDSEKRSFVMSKVKSDNTKPEVIVRHYLFARGLRYRKNVRKLPGKPDLVLPKYKTVVFINGCFWHGHQCKKNSTPETNKEYWQNKISNNVKRDVQNRLLLEDAGWNVLTVWECELIKGRRENTLEYLYYNILRNIND